MIFKKKRASTFRACSFCFVGAPWGALFDRSTAEIVVAVHLCNKLCNVGVVNFGLAGDELGNAVANSDASAAA